MGLCSVGSMHTSPLLPSWSARRPTKRQTVPHGRGSRLTDLESASARSMRDKAIGRHFMRHTSKRLDKIGRWFFLSALVIRIYLHQAIGMTGSDLHIVVPPLWGYKYVSLPWRMVYILSGSAPVWHTWRTVAVFHFVHVLLSLAAREFNTSECALQVPKHWWANSEYLKPYLFCRHAILNLRNHLWLHLQ